MSTRRMGLIGIPQEEWLLYHNLVSKDEDIPNCIKNTFMLLYMRADANRSLTISSKQAVKMMSGKAAKTFRTHLQKLRSFGLIGTSITKYGTYIEFYSPWLRYTRIRQKREQYSVEPNSWIHPRIAQYMHIAGKFPCDLKRLCKEYQSRPAAVEKAMESLAWDVIHRDLAENGYAYIPNKKHPGVYDLVMYKEKGKRLVHDNSMFPDSRDKNVWAVNPVTGKRTKITFERSVVEAVTVDPDLTEAVETRDCFDTQAYTLGFRMGQNAYEKQLHTSAIEMMEYLEDNQTYQGDSQVQNDGMTQISSEGAIQGDITDFMYDVKSEKRPRYVNSSNSNNTIMKLLSSLYIFHKEINRRGIRFASLRSCHPQGGNCKLQNAEAETEETTIQEPIQEPLYLHDTLITSHVYNNNIMSNTNITETEETDTETEQNITTILHDTLTYNGNVTETERNFTETTSEGANSAFSVSTPSNTDKTVRDSKNPLDILSRIRGKVQYDQKKQEQEKIQQKQKRADRKARKALRDALAGTDIKLPNLTSDAGADKLIADVCSHGLATDPDKVIPAWTVTHPAARWEAYQAEQSRVEKADKDVSWISNIATARKNASLKLTEPLESLSWRSTLSSTHTNPDRSLNALKRFKARFGRSFEIPEHLKKHYPDCYRDQK